MREIDGVNRGHDGCSRESARSVDSARWVTTARRAPQDGQAPGRVDDRTHRMAGRARGVGDKTTQSINSREQAWE